MTLDPEMMKNPQLDGSPFFWQGNETAILCLHGFTATTVEVRKIAEFLHQQGFTVSAPLLPGHGTKWQDMNKTQWTDWYATLERSFDELSEKCDHIGVAGLSMGGALVLRLAQQRQEQVKNVA